jgi:hypothetical protein
MDRILGIILFLILAPMLVCSVISGCQRDTIVKADEGIFNVPSDAIFFGSNHIAINTGDEGVTWWLWLGSGDGVTVVHHAKVIRSGFLQQNCGKIIGECQYYKPAR